MELLFQYMETNPKMTIWLSILLFLIILTIIIAGIEMTFKTINRMLRCITMSKHGYPPTHCDADGDGVVSSNKEQHEDKEDDKTNMD